MAYASRWNDDLVFKFIKLYKERPCLWRSDSPEYKCKPLRQDAIRSLVANMDIQNFDANMCKLKIKNLRSHYCQELKKIRHLRENRNIEYRPSLSWFSLLDSFLRQYVHYVIEPTSTAASFAETKIDADESERRSCERTEEFDHADVVVKHERIDDGDDAEVDAEADVDAEVEGDGDTDVNTDDGKSETRSRLTRTKRTAPYRYVDRDRSETEFDIFCRSVALQLNNMPLENALRLQHGIQNLVTEERLACLQNRRGRRLS